MENYVDRTKASLYKAFSKQATTRTKSITYFACYHEYLDYSISRASKKSEKPGKQRLSSPSIALRYVIVREILFTNYKTSLFLQTFNICSAARSFEIHRSHRNTRSLFAPFQYTYNILHCQNCIDQPLKMMNCF